MKNSKHLLVIGGLLTVAALTACNQAAAGSKASDGGASSTGTTQNIHIQLVPSNDPTTLLTRATALAPMLAKYTPGFTYTIDVGATYAATTTALVDGSIDGGFLTASGYAQETIDNPGTVEVVLSASRAGYKVQADDFPGFDAAAKTKQLAAMNGEIGVDGTSNITSANPAYSYLGQQSTTEVMYYSGIIITLRDSARTALGLKALDADGDGKTTLKELHDGEAIFGHMGSTSGAGMIYPTKYLYDAGYTKGFVAKADYAKLGDSDKALAVIGADETSYPNAVKSLMTGTLDAVCGFMDIRYGSAYVQDGGDYQNDYSIWLNGW